jgi:lipopolysaccharide/colanic/teichoic acid biosynthesis glycosyltransferase
VRKLRVDVLFSPSVYLELLPGRINGNSGNSLVSTFVGRRSDLDEFVTTLMDASISLLLLTAAAIPMLIIAALVKLTSPGPVIYRQQRVGKDGNIFTLYKFRTMFANAEHVNGLAPAISDDPRITDVGRLLRRLHLDELPQLFNVLQGKMSLVGPRPENLYRVNKHKALQGLRLAVKPGLTGLAQIRSHYDLHPEHKIKYDFLYIQRRSVALNIYILLKTIPAVLSGKSRQGSCRRAGNRASADLE